MEISTQSNASIKIKGKNVSFIVEPTSRPQDFQAALYFTTDSSRDPLFESGVVIDGPGEYEIGGVKIKGSRQSGALDYTLEIDGITMILGKLSSFEKVHGKLQEQQIACVEVDTLIDPSFMSGLATHYIAYFGKNAEELGTTFLKGEIEKTAKLSTTKDKLPQEMVTILLQ